MTVSGGTAPYTYNWSNGGSTQDLSNLGSGTYNVTVTDANGCSATATVTITEPAVLTLNLSSNNLECNGDGSGEVSITVTGGTTPYTYLWSDGSTSHILGDLSAGTYSVTVTDTNGCTTSGSATITQPDALTATIVGTDADCSGNSTGSADLTVTGGTAPYTYSWSNGATTEDISGLGSNIYSVTVTDNYDCEVIQTIIIKRTGPPNVLPKNWDDSPVAEVLLRKGAVVVSRTPLRRTSLGPCLLDRPIHLPRCQWYGYDAMPCVGPGPRLPPHDDVCLRLPHNPIASHRHRRHRHYHHHH